MEAVADGSSSLVDRAAKGLGELLWALLSAASLLPKGLGALPNGVSSPSNDFVLNVLFSSGDLPPKALGVSLDPALLFATRAANGFGLGSDVTLALVVWAAKRLGELLWELLWVVSLPPKGLGVFSIGGVLSSNNPVLNVLFLSGDLTPNAWKVSLDPALLLAD